MFGIVEFLQRALIANGGSLPPEVTQLLARSGVRIVMRPPDDEDEEEPEEPEDDDPFGWGFGNTRTPAPQTTKWFDDVTEPAPVGEELLQSGEFGRLGPLLESKKPLSRQRTARQCLRASKMQRRAPMREDIGRVSAHLLSTPALYSLTVLLYMRWVVRQCSPTRVGRSVGGYPC